VRTIATTDLDVVTYQSLSNRARTQFDGWVRSMTLDEDGEQGSGPNGALAWVRKHNAGGDIDGIHQTYTCLYRPTAQIIATASIVTDDRGVAATYSIETDGIWAFLNVRPDWRQCGVGKFLAAYFDNLCQQECQRRSNELTFSALSSNPASIKLLVSLGFSFQQTVFMEDFGCEQEFFSKRYKPQSRS
jgi:hypothetical protein